jgi:hypothetical protein
MSCGRQCKPRTGSLLTDLSLRDAPPLGIEAICTLTEVRIAASFAMTGSCVLSAATHSARLAITFSGL